MNIVEPILFQCQRQPPAAAICVPGSGIGLISYRRLEHFIHNVTRRLLDAGVAKGHVIAIDMQDVIFHAVVLLALTRLGAVTVSIRETDDVLPIKVDALISDSDARPGAMIKALRVDMSWTEGNGSPVEDLLLPQTAAADLCRIILTSGTTSTPKAVAMSHGMVAQRIARHLSVFGNRLGDCSRIYCDVPVSSSLGFQFLIYTLQRGGTVFFPGDDFQSTLPAIEQYKVQCIVGSPGGFENLLRWFDLVPEYQSNIDLLLCAGAVLSQTLSDRLRARICSHLVTYYGSTEASMSAVAHAHELSEFPQAVGFVTPGVTIETVDASGAVLPAGTEGYIRLKTVYAVDHYFRNPEETAKVFRDGWFYPGDIGRVTPENILIIAGREQAVLNLGGDKINPETIELVLSQYPNVSEAAVFGAPNEYGNGEIVAAVVSQKPTDQDVLKAYCAARLPPQFTPTKIYFVDSLPHNDMGKVDRNRLPEWTSQKAQRR